MNKKGQTLAIFVIILPILFIMLSFAFKLGNISVEKQKIENDIKSTIKYGLKHINEDNIEIKLNTLLDSNRIENKEIKIEGNVITINIQYEDILISYMGYIKDEKIIIERKWI